MTELKSTYPPYFISKNKMTLSPDMDVDKILEGLKENDNLVVKGFETLKENAKVKVQK